MKVIRLIIEMNLTKEIEFYIDKEVFSYIHVHSLENHRLSFHTLDESWIYNQSHPILSHAGVSGWNSPSLLQSQKSHL